jgi:glucose/arabinose dehydrogenase/putative cell wall-binding protein
MLRALSAEGHHRQMRRAAVALLAVGIALALVPPVGPARAEDPVVERASGPDRFATAAAVSADAFPQGAEEVLVATGERFADALAAGPAAAAAGGPVLLVGRDVLPSATRRELTRLAPDRITVLGGPGAITDRVVDALRAAAGGAVVRRLAGPDRAATAAALSAERFPPGGAQVYLADGGSFPDALAGGAAAGAVGAPVLLATGDALPRSTAEELRRLDPGEVVVLGGESAVSAAVAEEAGRAAGARVVRRAGADRIATAVAISAAAYPAGAGTAYLAAAGGFADALSGAPVAARDRAPVLLAQRDCIPGPVLDELARLDVRRIVLLGGTSALGVPVAELTACRTPPPAPPPSSPPQEVALELTSVVGGLAQPWDVVTTPDGRTFISERDSGRLLELDAGGGARQVQRLAVNSDGEGGLLGLAVPPGFADDGRLYAYVTTAQDNRVVRFRPGQEPEPVLTGIPRARVHNGGRLAFGPDGQLYIATGDAADSSLAPDRTSLAGKILRVTPDGDVPPGNPFPDSPVWSSGHRNVQGLAFDADGALLATEFGPDRDDEVNRIIPGGDYGWPTVTGAAGDERFIDPVIVRQPPEASWSGATFLSGGAIPQWEGDLFVAALRGQRLWRFRLDADRAGTAQAESLLVGDVGRIRQVRQAPDGALWLLTGNGGDDRLLRFGPMDG